MAEFSGFILTNKGRELLAKAVAGETLTFTKIGFGDGLYEGDKKEALETGMIIREVVNKTKIIKDCIIFDENGKLVGVIGTARETSISLKNLNL